MRGDERGGAAPTIHLLASAERRGAEVFATDLVGRLRASGGSHRVVAMAPAGAGRPAVEVDEVLPSRPDRLSFALRRASRGSAIVVGHGSRGLPGGTLATLGTRRAFVYRSIGDPRHWSTAAASRRARVGVQLRRAQAVVALWPDAADTIATTYRVRSDRIHVIPNAARADIFRPADDESRLTARRDLGLDDRPVVAIVGAMGPEKRIHLAAEAVAHLDEVQLLVVGDGPERSRVEAATAPLGERAQILGALSDVRPVYAAADVVVSTSVTEGQPGTLIEAALCGVPAVATDVGGVRSVVAEGGITVAADDPPRRIAEALSAVLDDRERRGLEARRHALAELSLEAVATRWQNLLDTLG